MKRHLRALILRQRGSQVFPLVLARIEDMSEEEARQWFRLLQNMQEDAARNSRGRFPHIR